MYGLSELFSMRYLLWLVRRLSVVQSLSYLTRSHTLALSAVVRYYAGRPDCLLGVAVVCYH